MASQTDACYLYLLPNEILLNIILFLDATSRVSLGMTSARLYGLVKDPLTWTHIIWNRSSKIMDEYFLVVALKWSRSNLTVLSVSSIGNLFLFSKVIRLVEACQGLRKIILNGVKLTAGQTRRILKLPFLNELYLEPETHVPLVFKEASAVDTTLKVFSYVETNCYYKNLLHDWGNANFKPKCVKVLLSLNSDRIYDAIEEMCTVQLSKFPTDNRADLCLYQRFKDTSLTCWHLSFCLQFQRSGAVVNVQEHSDIFCKKLVLGESSFDSGNYDIATFYPNLEPIVVPLNVTNSSLRSFLTLRHRKWSLSELHGVATSFTNLVCLDIKFANDGFLDGLLMITSLCTKLHSVSFDVHGSSNELINSSLWQSMGNLSNLAMLKLSSNLIPLESDPVKLSSLECFLITRHASYTNRLIDRNFYQFTLMPALKSFTFLNLPPITLYSGFSSFLKSVHLTYFHMEKIPGNKVTFPSDYLCYKNLKELYIHCSDFKFVDHLGKALCESGVLIVLSLKIRSIEQGVIKTMFDGMRKMMVFHITVFSNCTFHSNKQAKALSKALMNLAKDQKRNIDIVLQKIT